MAAKPRFAGSGGCHIAMLFFTPALMQMSGDAVKQIQAKADQQRKDQLEALKQKAAQAKTEEAISQIEQRQSALRVMPQVTMPDMSKMADAMKTPPTCRPRH